MIRQSGEVLLRENSLVRSIAKKAATAAADANAIAGVPDGSNALFVKSIPFVSKSEAPAEIVRGVIATK